MKPDVTFQLASINSAMNRVSGLYSRWAQKHAINIYALHILYLLYQEGSVTQKQISEGLKIPKQSVNNVATALKNDGFITLIPSEEDKREKKMILTEKGRDYSKDIIASLHHLEETVVQKMGEQLVGQLIASATAYGDYFEQEMEKEDPQ